MQNPSPIPYISSSPDGTVRRGDTLPVGTPMVLGYAFSKYRLTPLDPATLSFERANPRPMVSPDVNTAGEATLKIASMNMLNFFTTLDTSSTVRLESPLDSLDPRGANSEAEFDRQLAKLILAMAAIDADVYALQEVENGPSNAPAVATLVAELNALDATKQYAYVSSGDEWYVGTDAIRGEFIYRTDRVETTTASPDVIDGVGTEFFTTQLQGRPSLAQTFRELSSSRLFMVVNSHLKSKGSACSEPDAKDGQGNCNEVRRLSVEAIKLRVSELQQLRGTDDVLLVGDFNSYLCAASAHASCPRVARSCGRRHTHSRTCILRSAPLFLRLCRG